MIHNRPLCKSKDIIKRNGNLLPPVKIEKVKIQLMNTCSFDSLVELIANSDYNEYKKRVQSDFSDFVFFSFSYRLFNKMIYKGVVY